MTNWSLSTRLAFRATFLYALLVWAPLTLFTLAGAGWWNAVATAVGRWGIVIVLGLPERSAPYEGISTLLAPIVASVIFFVISLALACLWSVIDRRRQAHSRLFVWLHTVVRFLLGASLILYGFSKVYPGQFGLGVQPDSLVRTLGTFELQELLWAFMAASRPYTIFTGVVELAAGLLLLFRRTALMGALVAVVATCQVLMLNIAYDVIVKLFSAQLVLMAAFVAAPSIRELAVLLIARRPVTPRRGAALFERPALDRAARVAGGVVALVLIAWCWNGAIERTERRLTNRRAPLYGIWERQPPTDGWRYLVVPWNGLVVLVSDAGAVERYGSKVDPATKSLALSPRRAPGMPSGLPRAFTFSQPDAGTLVLVEPGAPGPTYLRRIEESAFPLNSRAYHWVW